MLYPLQIGAPIRNLTAAEISLLEHVAEQIPSEAALGEDDLASIRESLNALHHAIKDSTITKQAQKVFRDLIRITENSLRYYEIHGAKALRSAFIEMLGELLELYREQPTTASGKTTETSWWKAAQNHVENFGKVVKKVVPYVALLEKAIGVIGDAHKLLGNSDIAPPPGPS